MEHVLEICTTTQSRRMKRHDEIRIIAQKVPITIETSQARPFIPNGVSLSHTFAEIRRGPESTQIESALYRTIRLRRPRS